MTLSDTRPGTAEDLDAIAAVIAEVEASSNAKDVARSVAHFRPDATAVRVGGALVPGTDELVAAPAAS